MTKLIMKVFVPKLKLHRTMLPLLWLLYLLSLIPTGQYSCNTQSLDPVETCYCWTDTFKNFFFLCTIVEWNKLDGNIWKSKSYTIFQNTLLEIDEPSKCSIYRTRNPMRLKLLTRLRLVLSYLSKHRLNHNSQSCIKHLYSCSLEIKSTTHFFPALPPLVQLVQFSLAA